MQQSDPGSVEPMESGKQESRNGGEEQRRGEEEASGSQVSGQCLFLLSRFPDSLSPSAAGGARIWDMAAAAAGEPLLPRSLAAPMKMPRLGGGFDLGQGWRVGNASAPGGLTAALHQGEDAQRQPGHRRVFRRLRHGSRTDGGRRSSGTKVHIRQPAGNTHQGD